MFCPPRRTLAKGRQSRPAARVPALGLLSVLLLASGTASAQIVRVGNDAACDFTTLQAAVDSVGRGGTVTIRLSNDDTGMVSDPVL
ncbi:MAG: hypothetical protein AAGE01_15865, partial [Pseudomonadota bacterium]